MPASARQSCTRAGLRASLERSALHADCPAVLGLVAAPQNSLRSLCSLHSNSCDESDNNARWRVRPRDAAFLGAPEARCGLPECGFAVGALGVFGEKEQELCSRWRFADAL